MWMFKCERFIQSKGIFWCNMHEILNVLVFPLILTSVSSVGMEKLAEITENIFSEIDDTYSISTSSIEKACKRENFYYHMKPICRCDKLCSWHHNCCQDKHFCVEGDRKLEEFECVYTPFYGEIHMIKKCLPNYPTSDITEKCRTTNKTELLQDFLLDLPVTTYRNITYRNVFCAVCNNEKKFLIWNTVLEYRSVSVAENNSNLSEVDASRVLSNMKVNEANKIVSEVNGLVFDCNVIGFLPSGWIPSISKCNKNASNRMQSFCEQTAMGDGSNLNRDVSSTRSKYLIFNLTNSNLPRKPLKLYKNIIKEQDFEWDKTCYRCIPRFVKKIGSSGFFFLNDDTIFFEKFNHKFKSTEWRMTLLNRFTYICSDKNFLADWIKVTRYDIALSVIVICSCCFLILFLITMLRKKEKLKKLPDKIIFSVCITLLALYIMDRIPMWETDCKAIGSIISHYLYLSYHSWLVVTTFEFWRVINYCSRKLQKTAGVQHLKRYIIYCFLGWILPLSIIVVSVCFDSLPPDVIPCEWKPHYGKTISCFIEDPIPLAYFYMYPSITMFSIIIILFIHTAFHSYRYHRNRRINLSQKGNYYKLIVNLFVVMGVGWTLDILWMYGRKVWVHEVYSVVTAPLGMVMFFVRGLDKNMIEIISKRFNEFVGRLRTSRSERCIRSDSSNLTNHPTASSELADMNKE